MSARWNVAACALLAVTAVGCSFKDAWLLCVIEERCLVPSEAPIPRYPAHGSATGSRHLIAAGDLSPLQPQLLWESNLDQNWIFRVQLTQCPAIGASAADCPFPSETSGGQPDSGDGSWTVGLDAGLDAGNRYYWRARACDQTLEGVPCGAWSRARAFDVGKPERAHNDFTGDGYEHDGLGDVLVSEQHSNNSNLTERVYIFKGHYDGPGDAGFINVSPGTAGDYTVHLTGAGDLNGDGPSDFAVTYRPTGSVVSWPVHIYFGGEHISPTPDLTLAGKPGEFGFPVARVGDVDGDGYSDLVVGQRTLNRALLFRGGVNMADSIGGDAVLTVGPANSMAIAGGIDMDGDRLDDVVIATHNEVTVFAGRNPISGVWTNRSFNLPSAQAPYSLATGDFNGDGYGDFAIVGQNGAATVYPGSLGFIASTATPATMSFQVTPGAALVSVGDVNADGFDEFVATVPPPGTPEVRVYLGTPTLPPQPNDLLMDSSASTPGFGAAVAGLSDVTNDPFADIAVSGNSGVIIFRGDSDGVAGLSQNTLAVPPTSVGFGSALGSAY